MQIGSPANSFCCRGLDSRLTIVATHALSTLHYHIFTTADLATFLFTSAVIKLRFICVYF